MTQVIRDMKVKKPQCTKKHRFNILKAVMCMNRMLTVQNQTSLMQCSGKTESDKESGDKDS